MTARTAAILVFLRQQRIVLRVCVLLSVLVSGGARADQTDPRLDGLFQTLAAAENATEASPLETAIWRIWLQSGSDSVNLLVERGLDALHGDDYRLALRFFDAVVALAPDFAEGWNKRATVHYMMGDFASAVADIRQTLALEPRHFGALSGLSLILEGVGDAEGAKRTLEETLAIHPFLAGAADRLKVLDKKIEGRGI